MLINGKDSYSCGNLGMFISAKWERSMQNLEYHSDQWCREKNSSAATVTLQCSSQGVSGAGAAGSPAKQVLVPIKCCYVEKYLPPKATLSFHTLKPWAKKTTWIIKDTTWVIEDGAAIPRPSFLVHSKLSQLLKIATLNTPRSWYHHYTSTIGSIWMLPARQLTRQ